MNPARHTYTTREVARICETDRQTILAWDRRGVLKPSKRIGRERRYSARDVAAALIARTSRDVGFKPKQVNRIVELVQEADRGKLERAQIVTYKSETPGFMRHAFVDSGDTEHRRAFDVIERAGDVIDRATLAQIVEAVLRQIHEKYLQD
jgi:DNA-binding transcriptional MerR regulator